jgi:hypothetical protein
MIPGSQVRITTLPGPQWVLGVCEEHGSFPVLADEIGRPCPRCVALEHRPTRWDLSASCTKAGFRLGLARNVACLRTDMAIRDCIDGSLDVLRRSKPGEWPSGETLTQEDQ